MSEQEKKRQRIYDLFNAETKPKSICLQSQKKKKNLQKNSFLKKKGSGDLNKKRKGFLIVSLRQLKRTLQRQ